MQFIAPHGIAALLCALCVVSCASKTDAEDAGESTSAEVTDETDEDGWMFVACADRPTQDACNQDLVDDGSGNLCAWVTLTPEDPAEGCQTGEPFAACVAMPQVWDGCSPLPATGCAEDANATVAVLPRDGVDHYLDITNGCYGPSYGQACQGLDTDPEGCACACAWAGTL